MYFLDSKNDKDSSKKKSKKSKTSKSKKKSLAPSERSAVTAADKSANEEGILNEKVCDIGDIWNLLFGFSTTTSVKNIETKSKPAQHENKHDSSCKPNWNRPVPAVPKFAKSNAKKEGVHDNTASKSGPSNIRTSDNTTDKSTALSIKNKSPVSVIDSSKSVKNNLNSVKDNIKSDHHANHRKDEIVEEGVVDLDVEELKVLLTENTERRLKEGVVADTAIELELEAIRKKFEQDNLKQQEIARKKELLRKQEEELAAQKAARDANGVFGLFTPWIDTATTPITPTTNSPTVVDNASTTPSVLSPVREASSIIYPFPAQPMRNHSEHSVASGRAPLYQQNSVVSIMSRTSRDRSVSNSSAGSGGSGSHASGSNNSKVNKPVQHSANAVMTIHDQVSPEDISNFARFVSTDGVNCDFYLPTRDGDAKDKKALMKCDPDTTVLQLDIFASDYANSPIHAGSVVNKSAVIKSLTFDIFTDLLGVVAGRGPVVAVPSSVNNDSLLHILLYNKPEINLSFGDKTTRDVVLVALPKHLAQMRIKHTAVEAVLSPKMLLKQQHSVAVSPSDGTLMGLSKNLFKLTSYFWVQLKVKSLMGTKYCLRLMLTRNDNVLQFFEPPAEYESVALTNTAVSSTGTEGIEESVVVNTTENSHQIALNTQLKVYLQAKWNAEILTEKGFVSEMEVPFVNIEKVVHVGENENDNAIEIATTDDSTLKIRVNSAEMRRAIIVFLEGKRKLVRIVVEK